MTGRGGYRRTQEERQGGNGSERERSSRRSTCSARARYVMSDDTPPPRTCSAPPDATLETQAPRECERQKGRKFQGRSGRPSDSASRSRRGDPRRDGGSFQSSKRAEAQARACADGRYNRFAERVWLVWQPACMYTTTVRARSVRVYTSGGVLGMVMVAVGLGVV